MHRIIITSLVASAALIAGAAQAQNTTPTQSTADRPAETGIDNTNGKTPATIERAEKSRPAQATKRVAKKGEGVVANAGHKTANGVRNVGNGIAKHLPQNGAEANGASSGDMGTAPAQK